MTHTPGPWKIVYKYDTHKVKRDKEGRILGDVIVPFEDYQYACEVVNTHDELLEALKDCIEWLDRTGESVSEGGKEYEYVTMARKAINKAEGKGARP